MNLARFGLLKTSSGAMAPDGFTEEVEITEEEARALPREAYTVEFREQTPLELFAARAASFAGLSGESFGGGLAALSSRRPGPSASSGSRAASANRPISPRPVKYVKHEKRTTKAFVDQVKTEQGLLDLDGSILEMEARDLLRHFRRPNEPNEVDKNLFARNIVWHFYREILAGKMPDFVKEGCNIRTIYYIVKPIFTQKRVFADVDDFYGNFAEAFKTLVEIGLISYRDFNIMDDNKASVFFLTRTSIRTSSFWRRRKPSQDASRLWQASMASCHKSPRDRASSLRPTPCSPRCSRRVSTSTGASAS